MEAAWFDRHMARDGEIAVVGTGNGRLSVEIVFMR